MCNNFVDVASNANAARDRDGSNSPAWWSELNTISENNDLLDVQADAIAVAWGDAVGTLSQFQSRNRRGWESASLAADPRFVDEFGLNFSSAEQLARYRQR